MAILDRWYGRKWSGVGVRWRDLEQAVAAEFWTWKTRVSKMRTNGGGKYGNEWAVTTHLLHSNTGKHLLDMRSILLRYLAVVAVGCGLQGREKGTARGCVSVFSSCAELR